MTTKGINRLPPKDRDAVFDPAVRGAPPGIEPLAISIAEACRIIGMSRSEVYRRLRAKQIHAIKSGVRTLVLMDSLRKHLASLPPATFGVRTGQA